VSFSNGLLAALAVSFGVALGATMFVSRSVPTDDLVANAVPAQPEQTDYQTSDTCRACHPGAYHGWKDSFHRTMTQAVAPTTVLADWDGVELADRGIELRLEREGDAFWAEFTNPFVQATPGSRPAPPLRARVVMSTGSHHLQNYWIRTDAPGTTGIGDQMPGALIQLPFVWLIEEARWVPVQDSFLTPPSERAEPLAVWNQSCHLCHSVSPAPGFDGSGFETTTAELGIACEACHGPATEHIAQFRNPARRYLAHALPDDLDDRGARIVQPARLARDRSVEACGQCHSFSRTIDLEKWKRVGIEYKPGEPLAHAKALLRYSEEPSDPHLLAQLAEEPNALVGRFWSDGTIRVAGREMNGLVESACYARGEMTCLSCHSMHEYETPNDQLVRGGRGNGPCLECHPQKAAEGTAHTRHAEGSVGSECQNCHMPHTTYGLFKAIRSHRVDNPRVVSAKSGGRPNACNLCHLDKSLAWAERELVRGWGSPAEQEAVRTREASVLAPLQNPDSPEIAAGVVWALSGDAAQRALVAWHFGWAPAQQASGQEWMSLYLGQLLSDPYAGVRQVAKKSIARQSGFVDFEYDFLAPPAELRQKSEEAWGRFRESVRSESLHGRRELLILEDGQIDGARFGRLLQERERTPIRIIE
jgi:hypothetical protein